MRVFLQYPWKFPDSSYYKNILDFPPEGIEFVNYSKKKDKDKFEIIGSSKKFERMRKFKNVLRKILGFLQLPNLTYSKNLSCDLIHCAHCLSLNRKPWIVDTETYDRIAATGSIAFSKFGKRIIKNRLESSYCKKIICWSEDCRSSFEKAFPKNKKILDKIELLHFALPEPKIKKIKHKKLRVLFVARWFNAKGGLQTLHIFDKFSKKYPSVEFMFICPIPKEIKEKYSKNKNLVLKELMSQEILLNEIYPKTDIFFYPGFGDSYGFATPEILSYGIPVITSNTFAKNEQVIEGENGFLINLPNNFWKYENYVCMDKRMLKDFEEKLDLLINNKSLRKKMGKSSLNHWKKMFSLEKRNAQLKKIYMEAIKN
ncbi:MAG: glycosyltransferase family 4 protein [Nanoarchaeota archaeon]|nr:glycosyltransferase family 4 protein [Nanoarchaeota archaeon]